MRSYELPCHAVTLVHIAKGIVPAKAVAVHDCLHQTANVEETDLVLKEESDGFLVGTVSGAGAQAALPDGLFAGGKTPEGLVIRHIKGEHLQRGKVQLRHDARHPLGVGEGVLDGNAHIRHAQLCDH